MSSNDSNQIALLSAVKDNNNARVKRLLDCHGLIKDNDWMDYKILIRAIQTNNVEIVELLLDHGCRVKRNSKSHEYMTPLCYAVEQNNLDIVKVLLAKGASLKDKDCNVFTPLFLAMKISFIDAVDLMLSSYDIKEINPFCNDEIIHFNIACVRNNVNLVKAFIKCGMNLNSCVEMKDKEWPGYTPLHFAVEYQSVEVVEILLYYRANHNFQRSNDFMSPLHLAFHCHREVSEDNNDELKEKAGKIIDYLLCAQWFIEFENRSDPNGIKHFHIACTRESIQWKFLKNFLENELDLDDPISSHSPILSGYSPLHIAVKYNCEKTVKILLEHGANVHSKNSEGSTPLHIAVECKNLKIIQILMQYKPDLSVKNNHSESPLHKAFNTQFSDTSIVDILLSSNQRDLQNSVNRFGLSHFHIAAARNNVEVVKRFLEENNNVNMSVNHSSKNWPGYTALHFAATFRNKETVELLLKFKADVHAIDKYGFTPLYLACQQSYEGNFNLILEVINRLHKNKVDQENCENTVKAVFKKSKQRNVVRKLVRCNSNMNVENKLGVPLLFHAWDVDINYQMMNLIHQEETAKNITSISSHIIEEIYVSGRKMIELLIDLGIDVNILNINKENILHHIADSEYEDFEILWIAELVLKHGINVNTRDKFGKTPLFLAAERNMVEYTEILLKYNANPKYATPKTKVTPLHVATERIKYNSVGGVHKSMKLMDLLIAHGADVNARDKRGSTPLFNCLTEESLKCLWLLLRVNSNPNIRDNNGRTALFFAIKNKNFAAIDSLLLMGADINISDNKNISIMKYLFNIQRNYAFSNAREHLETFKVLELHLKKLKLINLPICYNNLKFCEKLKTMFEKPYRHLEFNFINIVRFDGQHSCAYDSFFDSIFEDELKRMKMTKIDIYTTLYDIVGKSAQQMTKHIKNETFKDLLTTNLVTSPFPNFSFILNSRFREGVIRYALAEPAKVLFQKMTGVCLPGYCYENIFKYLDDEDLTNLNGTNLL